MKNADMPAMPVTIKADVQQKAFGAVDFQCQGITKREMFAMHAMQGLLSSASDSDGIWTNEGPSFIASEAVSFADALLAELDK